MKFKVGDKIKLIQKLEGESSAYCSLKTGDIVTISQAEMWYNPISHKVEECYGFKEDDGNKRQANWLNVEKNFELVNPSWMVKLE